jgi:hypothetical protein
MPLVRAVPGLNASISKAPLSSLNSKSSGTLPEARQTSSVAASATIKDLSGETLSTTASPLTDQYTRGRTVGDGANNFKVPPSS